MLYDMYAVIRLNICHHTDYVSQVTIRCQIYPSEDPEKVKTAVKNIFPNAEPEIEGNRLIAEADLGHFFRLIRKERILDTARAQMEKGMHKDGRRTAFRLNKQVATVGKISFVDYHTVLGTLNITITDDDIEALIDKVAPETVNGVEMK